MSIKNLKPKKCESRALWLARFLHREGKKYCAVALYEALQEAVTGEIVDEIFTFAGEAAEGYDSL